MSAQEPRQLSETRATRIRSWVNLAIALILSVWAFVFVFEVRRGSAGMFSEMNEALPVCTEIVLSTAYLWIIPALTVLCIAKEVLLRNTTVARVWNRVHVALLFVVVGFFAYWLFAPMVSLIGPMTST